MSNINKHIHIINTHGIGDVIMTLPMLIFLYKSGYSLSMLVKSKVEASLISYLLQPHDINVVFLYYNSYKVDRFKGLWKLLVDTRKLKASVIVPTFSANELLYNLLAFFSGVKIRIGLGGPFGFLNTYNILELDGRHKVEKNISIARFLLRNKSVGPVDKQCVFFPKFIPDKTRGEFLSSFLKASGAPLVLLAPGSGDIEAHKRWPISNYAKLAKELLISGCQVAVIGGPGEEGLGAYVSKYVQGHECFYDMTGKLSITDVSEFIYMADCVVANCNGISHIASAVQTPVVGLYGPTDARLTGPYMQDLKIISSNMDCSPCYKRGFIEGCGKPICMSNILVVDVMKSVLSIVRTRA